MNFFKDRLAVSALVGTFAVLLVAAIAKTCIKVEQEHIPGHIRAVIQMPAGADTSRGLVTGYNYHLLQLFATESGCSIDIRLERDNGGALDSLVCGSADIVVLPFRDSLPEAAVVLDTHVDSISRWVTTNTALARATGTWLEERLSCESHELTREQFMRTYVPAKRARTGKRYDYLSPYDDLIKASADSIGWDWRLLAAVIYQESKFRIEALSRRGAQGLMQMMPRTAGHLEVSDAVNPSESITAGAAYLGSLEKLYRKITPDPLERKKYTLAAYNAGQGRIQDCINLAQLRGRDIRFWDETASVIPEMNGEDILQVDTVKLGIFKGVETVQYVESVLSLYDSFKTICP